MLKATVCVLLVTISCVVGDIDFMDCGSEKVYVEAVDIAGCTESPCPINRGQAYDVNITLGYLAPIVDSIRLQTYIQLWGAFFTLSSTCTNPCGTTCPLRNPLDRPRLTFTIEFPRTLIRTAAHLYIEAEHKNSGSTTSKMCVNMNVDLI